MSLPNELLPVGLLGAGAAGGYQIERSLRFNSTDSAYLSKTFASAGNRKTWTWAGWVKRTKLGGTYQTLFSAYSANGESTNLTFAFKPDDTLLVDYGSSTWRTTSAVYRDTAAWMHICLTADTPQATASNRMKLYVNGSEVTAFSTNNAVTQNVDLAINSTFAHGIGTLGGIYLLDGYLADVHFIDGQALDPTSFGEFDSTTGVWNPIQYDGTYGQNGFHLPFSDNSTASALGTDTSGNGNDWTTNNIAVVNNIRFSSYATTFNSTDTLGIAGGSWFDPNNTSQWTIEGWVNNPSASSGFSIHSGTNGAIANFGFSIGSTVSFQSGNGGWAWVTNTTLVANTGSPRGWCHFAAVRNGSTFEVFLNGVRIYTGTPTFGTGGTGGTVWINSYFNNGANYVPGVVSNLRIIQGTSLYSGAFYQVPSGPLTAVTGTTLLTLQDPTFVDNSTNNLTITSYATPTISSASIFPDFSGDDSLVDSPTNYGQDTGLGSEVRGNYATLNPLSKGSNTTLSNGNLDYSSAGATSTTNSASSTIGVSSGKYYWEAILTSSSADIGVGIAKAAPTGDGLDVNLAMIYLGDGSIYAAGSSSSYASAFSQNDVVNIALDVDAGKIWFGKNGTWLVSGNPETGANPSYSSGITGNTWYADCGHGGGAGVTRSLSLNFGQRPFAYSAPSGFQALCTTNLPAPTIENGSEYFDTVLYTGNDSTQTISGINFSPDFLWLKARSVGQGHLLYDTVRGYTKFLRSNTTDAEGTGNGTTDLTGFTSDGFTLGGNVNGANYGSATYAAWTWDAGSSTVTNNDGTISSQVRANPSAGFSIATYTGTLTSAGSVTVGHGLGAAPSLVISKSRSNTSRWVVQHKDIPSNTYLELNTTTFALDSSSSGGLPKPTSTVFYTAWLVGSNISGENFISYSFAPVEGYSSAFSYTGNGSADGPMVWLGFRPKLILYKSSSNAYNWYLIDTTRDTYNAAGLDILPNASNSESDDRPSMDILSNGFKLRNTYLSQNGNGLTYVGFAWAENPFSLARAR